MKYNQETRLPRPSVHGTGASVPIPQEEDLRALLAKGKTKPAVELAREIHKRCGWPETEVLLVDAYAARIRSLLKTGLKEEAKALFELVHKRYSSAAARLADVGVLVSASSGNLEELLRPLNDPAVLPEIRRAIACVVKGQVCDLSALAECRSLTADHPLRTAAAALLRAFAAVTAGPVEESALLLPEVSHRGPLASWKILVRAIAYFYQQDDAACERSLGIIDPDSAPARLIPALRTMLHTNTGQRLAPAAESLMALVCGSKVSLRRALQALDSAFQTKVQDKILPEIQRAVTACEVAYPQLLERLRQYISVRALDLDLPTRKVRAALGGASIKNAYFWRLYARSAESSDEALELLICAQWEQFRRHAVAEGWFAEKGSEAAALYLHMAELLLEVPAKTLERQRSKFTARFSGFQDYYEDQPPVIREVQAKYKKSDLYFLSPSQLFERACAIDPHREAFERWLNWAKQESDGRVADHVAELWHRALPLHSQPLLYLMESAEKRGALNRATAFLAQAQKLDAVNPEVRRAALRLLVAQTGRHLQQRKPHLVEQDVAALEALPQAQVADRPAFLAALRWAGAVVRGDAELASSFFGQIGRVLGSSAAAILACENAGALGRLTRADFDRHVPQVSLDPADSLVVATARVCALGDDLGAPFTIPTAWHARLCQELTNAHGELERWQLEMLGKAALRTNQKELAYRASAAGLEMGGDQEARFLLLRARALPEWEFERRDDCIAATVELGRRCGDMAIINEAIELRRGHRNTMTKFLDWLVSEDWQDFSMTTEQIHAVLQHEKHSRAFPSGRHAPLRVPFRETVFLDDKELEKDDEPCALDDSNQLVPEMGQPREKRPKRIRRDLPGQGDLF
ncbi:MAG TPA: hypothetical protein VK937_21630 [Candidatus Limnocylindria bacterium]|jgi:hypothetical protein|nr:hypothetical protein [Candidatus Limnocylindria bacterium]